MTKPALHVALVLGILTLAVGAAYAQQHDHSQMPAKPAASSDAESPEIFCGTMKTGQLCSHGTPTALGLTPEQTKVWLAAVRRYNKTVNDATLALQNDAKGVLSAAQMAEVERWFDVGVNPQLNELLAAPSRAKGK